MLTHAGWLGGGRSGPLPGAAPSFACLLARHDSNISLTGTIRLITLLARTTSPSALTVSGQLERALTGCQRSHPAACSVSWNAAAPCVEASMFVSAFFSRPSGVRCQPFRVQVSADYCATIPRRSIVMMSLTRCRRASSSLIM
jgi:hypothetical protein